MRAIRLIRSTAGSFVVAGAVLITSSVSAQTLWVVESANADVIKSTSGGGNITFASGGTLNWPQSIAFNSSGNMFVVNYYGNSITEFTLGGAASTFASGLSGPSEAIFGPNGNLYVSGSNSGNIYEFTPGGIRSTFVSGLSGYSGGLAFDSSGNLYFGTTANAYKIAAGTSTSLLVGSGLPYYALALAAPVAVTEPRGALLLGVAGTFFLLRKRKWQTTIQT